MDPEQQKRNLDALMDQVLGAPPPEEEPRGPQGDGSVLEVFEDDLPDVLGARKVVILDCWAPWCGPCRTFAPTFEAVAKEYVGRATFAKYNTDLGPRTTKAMGIQSIPTLLAFVRGKEVARLTGAPPPAKLRAFVDQALEG